MTEPNVRRIAFAMTGLTDRENAVVEKFLKRITKLAEEQAQPQDLYGVAVPMLCMMLSADCPEYSAKDVMGVAVHVINNITAALAHDDDRSHA